MNERPIRALVVGASVALAAIFLPKLFWEDSPLYTQLLTVKVCLWISGPTKLLFLSLGTYFAFRSSRLLGADNPAAHGWLLLSAGMFLWTAGQTVLVYYQLYLAVSTPFPSLADPLFVTGTMVLAAAAFYLPSVYFRSGLAMGTRGELLLSVLLSAAVLAAVGVVVLRPIVAAGDGGLGHVLNITYPTLDFILLAPCFVLTRLMLRLRGGRLWMAWACLLLGLAFVSLGDILYAYFSTLGVAALDPLLDLTFALGYILMAWGAFVHCSLARA